MKTRMSVKNAEPRVYQAMQFLEEQIRDFDIDLRLKLLIKIRVSQLNGCGYCIDMHNREAQAAGEHNHRLFALAAWWETPFFTAAEQAALRFAEQVTLIGNGGVHDDVYEGVRKHFSEQQVGQLLLAIIAINGWNRIAVSTHMMPATRPQPVNN